MRIYAIALALGLAGCSAAATGPFAAPQSVVPHTATQQLLVQNQLTAPPMRAFTAGVTPGFLASASALDMAPGAGESMWFTDPQTPAIGTISADGSVLEYLGLPAFSRPYSIVSDGTGNAWFTDIGIASVGRITAGGKIDEFTDASLSGTYPSGIVIGRNHAVWFIAVGAKPVLSRVSASGSVTSYAVAPDLSPDGSLIADERGNLWFLAVNSTGRTVMVERSAEGRFTRYRTPLQPAFEPCCPNDAVKRMAIGPDGNVWFTTLNYIYKNSPANWVGEIAPNGSQSYVRVRNGSIRYPVYPSGITASSNMLWFTGDDPFQTISALWSMTASGAMTAYQIPYSPIGIAAGRGSHLWFTSRFGGLPSQIVEVTLPN
jgi:streptogramin lyase